MRTHNRCLQSIVIILLLANGTLPLFPSARAQGSTSILSVSIPADYREVLNSRLLGAFEADHPGVKIQVVTNSSDFAPVSDGIEQHLSQIRKYVTTADVLFVDARRLTPEAVQGGFYLDLSPLASDDKMLKSNEFFPALWQAFQWDRGLWALPVATDVYVLSYQPDAFDRAGVAYPSEQWALADLERAVRQLALRNADNQVVRPGLDLTNDGELFVLRSLLGTGLFDTSSIPNPPQLTAPGAEELLNTWNRLVQENLISHDVGAAPISIASTLRLMVQATTSADKRRTGVLLPGGKAGLDTLGFAVSPTAANPELAYDLARFFSTRAEIAAWTNITPARQSLVGARPDSASLMASIPPDVQNLILQGIDNGLSTSDMRYADYLASALAKMKTEHLDAGAALQTIETQAIKEQQTASDQRSTPLVSGNLPVQPTNPSKLALRFGIYPDPASPPDLTQWTQLAGEFSRTDPQVGGITFTQGAARFETLVSENDCFYVPFNVVPAVNPALLLNLDPFFNADPTFDKADILKMILPQLIRDNKTWAYPVDVEPAILMVDSERFSQVGLPVPARGWTVDAFLDALKTLKPTSADAPPFEAIGTRGVHLLMLIAAYGGIPLDFRTSPPTINFSDPASVAATRQVLDLARQGYFKYQAVGNILSLLAPATGTSTAPIYTDWLTAFNLRHTPARYRPATYPKGSQYAAVSLNVGTAYISATSHSPEACYRWISTLASHPELFSAMPARRSFLRLAEQNQGSDVAAFYEETAELLDDPNTIPFPPVDNSLNTSLTGYMLQHWLYQAFDSYVLEDRDLEASLKDAEVMAQGFETCVVNLPSMDVSNRDEMRSYIKQFSDCVVKVDPSLKLLVSMLPQ